MSAIIIVYTTLEGGLGLEQTTVPPEVQALLGPREEVRSPVDMMQHGRSAAGPPKDVVSFSREVAEAADHGECTQAYGLADRGVGFLDDDVERIAMFHAWLVAAECQGRAQLTEHQLVRARREAAALAILDPKLEDSIETSSGDEIGAWRKAVADGEWWTVTLATLSGDTVPEPWEFHSQDFWTRWREVRVNGVPVDVSSDGIFKLPMDVVNDVELVHLDGSYGPSRRIEGAGSREWRFQWLARADAMRVLNMLPEDGAQLYVDYVAAMPGAEAGVDLVVVRSRRMQYWTWRPGDTKFTRMSRREFRDEHVAP